VIVMKALVPLADPQDPAALPSRRRLTIEVWILIFLSLGKSGVYAAVRIVENYLKETPVGDLTTTVNPSRSSVNIIDLVYQVLAIGFSLVPVALALFLLSSYGAPWRGRLGLTGPANKWWADLGWGAGLAALIGLPGLVWYAFGRAIGQTLRVNTSGLPDAWWAATILIMAAVAAALLEEFIVVGYLLKRLQDLRWSPWAAIAASALLRGTYHLYQGWPMALGNMVMGVVFAWYFMRKGRLGPLVAAHFLLDLVSFLGPEFIGEERLAEWGIS
jgi:membrane protease YdiL (CAAX protease family)